MPALVRTKKSCRTRHRAYMYLFKFIYIWIYQLAEPVCMIWLGWWAYLAISCRRFRRRCDLAFVRRRRYLQMDASVASVWNSQVSAFRKLAPLIISIIIIVILLLLVLLLLLEEAFIIIFSFSLATKSRAKNAKRCVFTLLHFAHRARCAVLVPYARGSNRRGPDAAILKYRAFVSPALSLQWRPQPMRFRTFDVFLETDPKKNFREDPHTLARHRC